MRITNFLHFNTKKHLRTSLRCCSLSKNLFFDRLTEVKGAIKTSNTTPKCMWILERGVLRSKAKCLAKQVFCNTSVKKLIFLPSVIRKGIFRVWRSIYCILPVDGFFDALGGCCTGNSPSFFDRGQRSHQDKQHAPEVYVDTREGRVAQ